MADGELGVLRLACFAWRASLTVTISRVPRIQRDRVLAILNSPSSRVPSSLSMSRMSAWARPVPRGHTNSLVRAAEILMKGNRLWRRLLEQCQYLALPRHIFVVAQLARPELPVYGGASCCRIEYWDGGRTSQLRGRVRPLARTVAPRATGDRCSSHLRNEDVAHCATVRAAWHSVRRLRRPHG